VVLKVNAPGHKTRYNGKVHDYRDKAPTTSWGSMDHRIRVGAIAVLALGDMAGDSYSGDPIAVDESSFYWNDVPTMGWGPLGRRVRKARPSYRKRVLVDGKGTQAVA